MAIQAEDLFPGRYVTVLKGAKTKMRTMFGTMYEHEHNALLASVLRVKGLSLPYVAVEVLYDASGNGLAGKTIALDTRVMQFGLVDESYARALVAPQLLDPPQARPQHPPRGFVQPMQALPPEQWGRALPEAAREEPMGVEGKFHITGISEPVLSIAKADCDICGGENFEHAKTCVRHPANRAKRKQ